MRTERRLRQCGGGILQLSGINTRVINSRWQTSLLRIQPVLAAVVVVMGLPFTLIFHGLLSQLRFLHLDSLHWMCLEGGHGFLLAHRQMVTYTSDPDVPRQGDDQ